MNISLLSVKMMLNLSASWLGDKTFVAQLLAAGPLGVGVHAELEAAHAHLAGLAHGRKQARKQVRALINLCTRLDALHDRKARGLFYLLLGLGEISDEADAVEHYRELRALLFPERLRVVQLPYTEEGGAAVELDRAVGSEIRGQLGAVSVGGQTLEQVFESWISAGRALGESVQKRMQLEASIGLMGSIGTELDMRRGRGQWLQAVRGLLWVLEVRPGLDALSESVHAAIFGTVDAAQRRKVAGRVEGEGAEGEGLEVASDEGELELGEGEPDEGELDEGELDEGEPASS